MISDVAILAHLGVYCLVNSPSTSCFIDSGVFTLLIGKSTLLFMFTLSCTTSLVTFANVSSHNTHTIHPTSFIFV